MGGEPNSRIDFFGLKPGNSFATPEMAVIDALNYINGRSICEGLEYAGWIYIKRNWFGFGKPEYTYDEPNRGTEGVSRLGKIAKDKVAVGGYHTHAAYNPRYEQQDTFRHKIK